MPENTTRWKILQIMPADGWLARYKGDAGVVWHEPLIAWALVDNPHDGAPESDRYFISGVMSSGGAGLATGFPEGDDNFDGYVHPSQVKEPTPPPAFATSGRSDIPSRG